MISYNIYQYWQGRYYPALPFIQPVYPILAGLLMFFFNLKAVILFNILLLSINCVLIYLIVRLYYNRVFGLLISLLMGLSEPIVYTAMYPWTEQLHLFLILLTMLIYLKFDKFKNRGYLLGILLGISFLVRAASVFNILAFGLALVLLNGVSKEAIQGYLKVALGFLMVFLPYEIFCFIRYQAFYPQYFKAAYISTYSVLYEGAYYQDHLPVLRMKPLNINGDLIIKHIYSHLIDLLRWFKHLKFVLILAPLHIIMNRSKKKNHLLILLFSQGIFVMTGYTLSLTLTPGMETSRYLLIPYITWGCIGFLAIQKIFNYFFYKKNKKFATHGLIIILSFFLTFQLKNHFIYIHKVQQLYIAENVNRMNRDIIFDWIKTNTKKDDLIACDLSLTLDAFLFERPTVRLPAGKAATMKNIEDFFRIYQPEYVLTTDNPLIEWLVTKGYSEIKMVGSVVLMKGL